MIGRFEEARQRDIDIVLKYRKVGTLLFLLLTLFFAFQIRELRLVADPMGTMYLSDHGFLEGLRAIDELVPERRMLVCILDLDQGDIYRAATIKKIDELSKGLLAIDGVLPGGIVSLTQGIDHYNNSEAGLSIEPILGGTWPSTPEEFARLKRRLAVNPMGPGRYVAYDSSAVMITARLVDIQQEIRTSHDQLTHKPPLEAYAKQRQAAFNAGLLQGLRDLKSRIDDENHHLYFMGQEVLIAQMTEMGKRDIPLAAGAMLGLLLLLLGVYFRRVAGVLIPLLCMGIGMVWVMGICAMLGIELHPMALLFPLILGLVILGYATLLMAEYYRVKTSQGDGSISEAFSLTALLPAILILGFVCAVMYLVPVPLLRDLGAMGIVTVFGALGVLLLGVPSLIALLPVPRPTQVPETSGTGKGGGPGYVGVLVIAALVIGGGALAATRLGVGGNVPGYDYISKAHPWARCFTLLSDKFMGPKQLLVYVEADSPGGLLEPEALKAIGAFSRFLRNAGGAKESIAFDMMVCLTRGMLTDANPKWRTIPVSRDQIFGLSGMIMEEGGAEEFMGPRYTRAVISPFFSEHATAAVDAYAARMQGYIDTHPAEHLRFSLGGGLLGMTKILNDTTREAYGVIIVAAFLGLLLAGALASGSLAGGLLILLPVAAAQALMWILMLLCEMELGLPLVAVTPVALGFGAMFGLYGSRDGFAPATLAWTGGLVCAACLPWSLIGLRFQGGMLAAFGMLIFCITLCSLGFMPVWRRWNKRTARLTPGDTDG